MNWWARRTKHSWDQMLFAFGDTYPSLVLVREVETLRPAELAEFLLAALAAGLEVPLAIGAIATLTPDRVRFRPLPLRPDAGS